MVADRTGDLVGQARRQQTPGEPPRDRQRDVLSTGCQWRAILKDLPLRSTAFAYLDLWIYDGTLDRIPLRALRSVPRTNRPRGRPCRLHYRTVILRRAQDEGVRSAEKGGRASIRLGSTQAADLRQTGDAKTCHFARPMASIQPLLFGIRGAAIVN
jgi:transposase